MASEITLYWGSGSGPCWRVMIALEEKGLSGYTSKLVSFEKGEHKSEDILKLNPRGQVPTLKHGNIVINESLAALLYLQSSFQGQGTDLMPCKDDPAKKALILQRMMEVNDYQKAMFGVFMYVRSHKDNINEEEFGKLKETLRKELKVWDGYLEKLGGNSFITGDSFTLADVSLFPMVAVLPRQGLDLAKHLPNLAKYYDKIKDRPSVQASWPPHFKETPNQDNMAKLFD